jgi:hypothetical protein
MDSLQMIAQGVVVPVRTVGRLRLQDVPGLLDEAYKRLAPLSDGVGVLDCLDALAFLATAV